MQHIDSLSSNIIASYPHYHFAQSDDFKWSPDVVTIYHAPLTTHEAIWSLLHEIAHAELAHATYTLDVELVQREVAAWEYARTALALQHNLTIDPDYIEDHINTYRVWLHARSTCPDCSQNGLQTKNTYSCINCRCVWQANEAKICALRRVRLPSRSLTS